LFGLAVILPWYVETAVAEFDIGSDTLTAETRAVLWTQFWYKFNLTHTCTTHDFLGATNKTCEFESGITFWKFDHATQNTRILFGSAWCFVVLGLFFALGSVISGQKKPLWLMIGIALFSVIGFASFFGICIRADSAAYGCDNATFGPCNSFVGTEENSGILNTTNYNAYWGPSWGLYFTIIAGFWVTILAFVSCLGSIFCGKPNPRPELQGLLAQPMHPNYAVPVNYPPRPIPPPEQHVIIGANQPVHYLVVDSYNPGSNSNVDYPGGVEIL